MKLETLTQVNVERAARRPVIVITDTANGDQRLVKAKDIATDPLSAELSKQLRMGKSGTIESGGKSEKDWIRDLHVAMVQGPTTSVMP